MSLWSELWVWGCRSSSVWHWDKAAWRLTWSQFAWLFELRLASYKRLCNFFLLHFWFFTRIVNSCLSWSSFLLCWRRFFFDESFNFAVCDVNLNNLFQIFVSFSGQRFEESMLNSQAGSIQKIHVWSVLLKFIGFWNEISFIVRSFKFGVLPL